jgi:hypothetical protein
MVNYILLGATLMSCGIISLFFLKFWRNTHDVLFLYFSSAFALDAFARLASVLVKFDDEHQPLVFVIRLCAYLMIIGGIISKNRTVR